MIIFYYILRQIIFVTLGISSLIFIMIWLIQSLRQIELVVENGASFREFLFLSILPSPLWIIMTFPIGFLIAVIILFNKLHNDKETLMIQFSGIKTIKIIQPVVLFGLFSVLILSLISMSILPKAFSLFKSKQYELRNNISQIFLREGIFIDLQPGLTIFVEERKSKFDLSGIFIFDSRNKEKDIDTTAKKGTFLMTKKGPMLELYKGKRRVVDKKGRIISELKFDNYSMSLSNEQKKQSSRWLDVNEKSILELLKEDDPNSKSEAHFRITLPFLTLTLPLQALVLLLCVKNYRENQTFQITIALLVALTIQILMISMRQIVTMYPNAWLGFYCITILPILLSILYALIYDKKIIVFKFNGK